MVRLSAPSSSRQTWTVRAQTTVIAARRIGEALTPAFRAYSRQVIENAKVLADALAASGMAIVSGGTDSHLMLVDLRPKGVTGKAAEASLERANITCNKNGIPFDPSPPAITSGLRLGSPAGTTRGFGPAEFRRIGQLIAKVVDGLAVNGEDANAEAEGEVRAEVLALTARFPIYG